MTTNLLIPASVRTAIQLQEWIKENGTIAFEHGFKSSIKFQGQNAKLTMIERNGVHLYIPTGKQQKTIPFTNFTSTTISKIVDECNKYYKYCLTEA